jgi:hypothetical protein
MIARYNKYCYIFLLFDVLYIPVCGYRTYKETGDNKIKKHNKKQLIAPTQPNQFTINNIPKIETIKQEPKKEPVKTEIKQEPQQIKKDVLEGVGRPNGNTDIQSINLPSYNGLSEDISIPVYTN